MPESWGRLTKALDMSQNKIEVFIGGDQWGPHYVKLYEAAIEPAQLAAKDQGARKQGPRLSVVHTRIIAGERDGQQRFSRRTPDKKNWDVVDHYAYFLVVVSDINMKSADGIFYGKGLTPKQCYERT